MVSVVLGKKRKCEQFMMNTTMTSDDGLISMRKASTQVSLNDTTWTCSTIISPTKTRRHTIQESAVWYDLLDKAGFKSFQSFSFWRHRGHVFNYISYFLYCFVGLKLKSITLREWKTQTKDLSFNWVPVSILEHNLLEKYENEIIGPLSPTEQRNFLGGRHFQ